MKKHFTYIAVAFLMAGMVSAQNIDINAMPQPGPTPTVNVGQPQTFQLKNGMTVMVVENHKLPRVIVSLSMDNPPFYEGKIAGVSDIMADQLDKGTKTISKDDFSKKVDFYGANLNFSSNGASANMLSKYFPQIMNLMADAIVNPKFKPDEIQTSKDRSIESLKSSEKDASFIASRVYNALVYGKNTALGEFETQKTIGDIQPADVEANYKNYYIPDNAYLVVVGDVKFKEVKNMVEKLYSKWAKANTKFQPIQVAQNVGKTQIDVVDVPTAVQSIINVGDVTALKMNNPSYFAAVIGNYILGGSSNARLFMNLREKHAYTYGAYSSLDASKDTPSFVANASVRNAVTADAITQFMNELNGASTVTAQELKDAKAKLQGSFIMSLERPSTIAMFAINQRTQSLPANFYSNYLKSIESVTTADVANATKSIIFPNQARIFVAGKASEISDGLEKLGYPVSYFDREGNPAQKPEVQQVAANVNVNTIATNYLNAIGGAAAVAKINSFTFEAKATVQGQELNLVQTVAKGGKNASLLKMAGNVMQKTVFDGKKGYVEAMGQKQPLPEDQIKEMTKEPEIFPELNFGKSDNYKLKGIEKFNGEDAYAVTAGPKTLYYSTSTGLKTGEVQSSPQGEVTVIFSDYKDVSGVKFPFKITQQVGPMSLDFVVQSYKLNQAKDSDFK